MPETRALLVSLEDAWRAGPSEALESQHSAALRHLEALPATDEQRLLIAQVRLSRAGNLALLGHHETAELLFASLHEALAALPDRPAVRLQQARLHANRAARGAQAAGRAGLNKEDPCIDAR